MDRSIEDHSFREIYFGRNSSFCFSCSWAKYSIVGGTGIMNFNQYISSKSIPNQSRIVVKINHMAMGGKGSFFDRTTTPLLCEMYPLTYPL